MAHIEGEILVKRPAEEVFDFVAGYTCGDGRLLRVPSRRYREGRCRRQGPPEIARTYSMEVVGPVPEGYA
jgi:hypothetical protein